MWYDVRICHAEMQIGGSCMVSCNPVCMTGLIAFRCHVKEMTSGIT